MRDSGSADAEVRNELRFFSEASAAALHALEDSLPPNDPVSLPPQRSDETPMMARARARRDRLTGGLSDDELRALAGARSGAGAEEAPFKSCDCDRLRERLADLRAMERDRADLWWVLGLEPSATAAEASAAITTLRAQLAEAQRENGVLRDALEAVVQNSMPFTSEFGPRVDWDGFTWKMSRATHDKIDAALAAVHPTEENR